MATATPATAALDRAGLPYTLHPYDHDPRATGFGDEAAARLGVPPERLFKTLMVEVTGRPEGRSSRAGDLCCAVVPVAGTLDLKACAREFGAKRATMADPAAAERSSGYVLGGISPLGQRTAVATLVDETAVLFETVFVSAGQRGLQVELAPADLCMLVGARYAGIAAP